MQCSISDHVHICTQTDLGHRYKWTCFPVSTSTAINPAADIAIDHTDTAPNPNDAHQSIIIAELSWYATSLEVPDIPRLKQIVKKAIDDHLRGKT